MIQHIVHVTELMLQVNWEYFLMLTCYLVLGESLNGVHIETHSDELLKMVLPGSGGVYSAGALETSLLPLLKTGTVFRYCQVTTQGTGYSAIGIVLL